MLCHIFLGKVPCALAKVAGEKAGKPTLLCLSVLSLPRGLSVSSVSFLCCREPELSLRLMYLGFLGWWQAGVCSVLSSLPTSALSRCLALVWSDNEKGGTSLPGQSEMDEKSHWDWGICRSSTRPRLWAFGNLNLLVILRLEIPSSSDRAVLNNILQGSNKPNQSTVLSVFWWSLTKSHGDALDSTLDS